MTSKTMMIPSKTRQDGTNKASRNAPSEALHMTTRHAAACKGRLNSDPSINGSLEDDNNRRTPIDEVRPTTSRSPGSPTSAKYRRISGTSNNSASGLLPPFDLRSSDRKRRRSSGRALSPAQHQPSPVKKRRRLSPTPQPGTPENIVTPNVSQSEYPFDAQFIEVVPREALSDRGMGSSSSQSGSVEQLADDYMGVAESTEFTPAVSQAVSPVSEESDTEVPFLNKDVIKTAFPKVEIAEAERVDDGEEVVEAEEGDEIDDADDIDVDVDVDDGDDHTRASGDGLVKRKWTGRRRADHHMPEIEAAIRRQAVLRSMYRAISRVLKPVLEEVANKTVELIETNPTKHEEVVEYQGTDDEPGIQKQLDQALEKRRQQIYAQLKWNKQLLEDSLAAEAEVRKAKWRSQVEQMRDLQLDRLEYDMLKIARKAQLSEDNVSHETDDEDGDILLKPKGMAYRFARKNALDPKYDSRSRLALEAERATEDLHARYEMTKMLRDFKENEEVERERGFTVMDPRARNAAITRSASIRNTKTLASAAAEVEVIVNKPVIAVIPNAQAHGLQMLSDLATRSPPRPSFAGLDLKPMVFDPLMNAKPPMHMPPPLPPPPPMGRRNFAFDIINLLQHELSPYLPGLQQRHPLPNMPDSAFSSSRRSSVPAPVSREPGLMSPISGMGGALAFPSSGSVPAPYGGPQYPRESAPQSQHSRTASLGTPARPEPPRFAANGADANHWGHMQSSPGGNAGRHTDARNAAAKQQPPFQHAPQGSPLTIMPIGTTEPQPTNPVDRFNDNSPSNNLLARPIKQSISQSQREAASSTEAVAPDSRNQRPASPREPAANTSPNTSARQPRSRESSTKSQSTNRDNTPDVGGAAESAQHQKGQQSGMHKFPSKLNRDQRGGVSRKDLKRNNRLSWSGASPAAVEATKPVVTKYPLNGVTPNAEMTGTKSRWRLNKSIGASTTTTTPQQQQQQSGPWTNSPASGPPQSGPPGGYYPPQMSYNGPQRPFVPPPLSGFPTPYYLDPNHRSSLPGQGPQPWQGQPPRPSMYGPSRGQHPPGFPPPPPPDHWPQQQQQNHQQQHPQQQQPPQQYTPLNPARGPQGTMQPAAPPMTQQYGGPTIAPATTTGSQDSRSLLSNSSAGPNNRLPAFAQRGGQDAAGKARGRAQSDAPAAAKFLAYVPKGKPGK